MAEGPSEPLKEEAETEEEAEDCNACGWMDCDCRNQANDCWSNCCANIGGGVQQHALVFAIITPLVWGCLAIGLVEAEWVTDLDSVWVDESSRLGDEKDFYDKQFGGLSRMYEVIFKPQDPTSDNVFTTGALQELHRVDQEHIDFTPWYDPGGYCATKGTADTCLSPQCSWMGGQCLESDTFGVKPSHVHRHAITYLWRGRKYGLREVCREPFARGPVLQSMRLPCSDVASPLQCFSEHPLSHPPWAVRAGASHNLTKLSAPAGEWDWAATHSVSFSDSMRRGFAYAAPCANWAGSYASKAETGGDWTIIDATHPDDATTSTKVTRVGGLRYIHRTNNAKQFVRKWKYIMEHNVSGPIYRDMGYPVNITEAEAEEIISGWEEAAHNRLLQIKAGLQHTRISFVNKWSLDKIVEDAAERNIEYVVIGLCLVAVVVWLYLLAFDPVLNRIGLGVGAIICIASAVGGTMGLAALFQIDFNGLTVQVVPYVVMGLGIDDMFVLVHYFHIPKYAENIEHRMRVAYAHAGPSIFATSLVNLVVFLIVTALPIGVAKDVAYQSAIAVFTSYTVIIFGFGAMMALDAARVVRNQCDVICCIEQPEEEPRWRRVGNRICNDTREYMAGEIQKSVGDKSITIEQAENVRDVVKTVTDAALTKMEHYMQKEWQATTVHKAMQQLSQAMHDSTLTAMQGALRKFVRDRLLDEAPKAKDEYDVKSLEKRVDKVLGVMVLQSIKDEVCAYAAAQEDQNELLLPLEALRIGQELCDKEEDDEKYAAEEERTICCDTCTAGILRGFGDAVIVSLPGRIVLSLILAGVVGVGIFGCTQLTIGLPVEQLVEEDSIENQFFRDRHSIIPGSGEEVFYVGGIDSPDLHTDGTHIGVESAVAFSSHPIQYQFNKLIASEINSLGSQDPQLLAASDQWSLNFRKAIFGLQNADPQTQLGRWWNTTTIPSLGSIPQVEALPLVPAESAALCDNSNVTSAPWNCVVRQDIYYEMLGVWCGESSCYRDQCNSILTNMPDFQGVGSQFCDQLVLRIESVRSNITGSPEPKMACDGIRFHQSRIVQTTDISDAVRSVRQMDEARAKTDSDEQDLLGVFPYGRVYLYNEQFKHIRDNFRVALIVVMIVLTLILSLVFLSLPMGLIQGVNIACSVTCIVALIPACGLYLNTVSLLIVLFGVAINVELTVHICRVFDTIQEGSRAERAVEALARMGGPVLCGALSTFLSVAILQASETRIYYEYFFQFNGKMILTSLFFTWTLLPLLLTFFGPVPLHPLTVDREIEPVVDDKPHLPLDVVSVDDLPNA